MSILFLMVTRINCFKMRDLEFYIFFLQLSLSFRTNTLGAKRKILISYIGYHVFVVIEGYLIISKDK